MQRNIKSMHHQTFIFKTGRKKFDASLWITPQGEIEGISTMIHAVCSHGYGITVGNGVTIDVEPVHEIE